MFAEVSCQHQHDWNLDELRWLKLSDAGQLDPTALSIDPQTNARHQDDHQQHETKDVKDRCKFNQSTVIAERNREHEHKRDRQTYQLLLPVAFGRLRVVNFPSAKTNDGDGQNGDQPIEISEFAFLQDSNHESVISKRLSNFQRDAIIR